MKSFIAKIFLISLISFPLWATDSPLSEAVSKINLVSAKKPITTFSIDGVDVGVGISAWSDTLGGNNYFVESAQLGTFKDSLTVLNFAGDGDDHYIDNGRYYDMVLFSFEEAVTLKGASFFSIDKYKKANGKNDVTVAGLSDDALGLFTSGKNTWNDISMKAIAGASGHFGINNLQSTFEGLNAAKYWLVGAYNSVFSSVNNKRNSIGFKLAALDIELKKPSIQQPPTEVSEPGALALMSLGLGLVLYRRKRRA
ncbi:exosortase-dependent surface protein XDP1 [Alteromonas sp. P256]|uniref:exosortase-dependent surface protein XDP1 n=1 Tax=Alteromonas sp. P256 TaxID=3117399 RepID=UPI002FE39A42